MRVQRGAISYSPRSLSVGRCPLNRLFAFLKSSPKNGRRRTNTSTITAAAAATTTTTTFSPDAQGWPKPPEASARPVSPKAWSGSKARPVMHRGVLKRASSY